MNDEWALRIQEYGAGNSYEIGVMEATISDIERRLASTDDEWMRRFLREEISRCRYIISLLKGDNLVQKTGVA